MLAILIISVLLIAAAALFLRKNKDANLQATNAVSATENLTAPLSASDVSADLEPSVIVSPTLLISEPEPFVEEKPVDLPVALKAVEAPPPASPPAPVADKPTKTRKPTKIGIKDRPTKPTKVKAAKKNKKR